MEKNERERLLILFDHWVNHNKEHISQYQSWVKKLEAEGLNEVANRLKQASELILQVNQEFSAAKEILAKS